MNENDLKWIAVNGLDLNTFNICMSEKLEIQKNALGFLSAEDEDFLQAAIRIKEQKLEQKRPITERISEIEKLIALAGEANFRAMRSLHAGVTLKIKGFRREIDSEYGRITAYANSLGIVIS